MTRRRLMAVGLVVALMAGCRGLREGKGGAMTFGDDLDFLKKHAEIVCLNDGPPEPGKKPPGPFYELESSSPAAELGAGQTITHIHRTFHLRGEESDLDPVAKAVLGVSLADIKAGLK